VVIYIYIYIYIYTHFFVHTFIFSVRLMYPVVSYQIPNICVYKIGKKYV
jgi:hypothetical protein